MTDQEPTAYFVVPRTRQRVKLPTSLGEQHRFPRSPDQADAPSSPAAAAGNGCRNCTDRRVIRLELWAGVIWYGVPYPKRIRFARRFPFLQVLESEGCGCIKVWRDLWVDLSSAWRVAWRRHRIAIELPLKRVKARAAAMNAAGFKIPAMGGGYVNAAN